MKRHRILFHETYTATPLSFWVHWNLDDEIWANARKHDPPLPTPLDGKGWPMLEVVYDDLLLYFASAQELHHFLLIISKTPLPTVAELCKIRGIEHNAGTHWLERLPEHVKSPVERQMLFAYLVDIAPDFVKVG